MPWPRHLDRAKDFSPDDTAFELDEGGDQALTSRPDSPPRTADATEQPQRPLSGEIRPSKNSPTAVSQEVEAMLARAVRSPAEEPPSPAPGVSGGGPEAPGDGDKSVDKGGPECPIMPEQTEIMSRTKLPVGQLVTMELAHQWDQDSDGQMLPDEAKKIFQKLQRDIKLCVENDPALPEPKRYKFTIKYTVEAQHDSDEEGM